MSDITAQTVECERAVLGAILLDNGCMDEALETLVEGDFGIYSHGKLFGLMKELHLRKQPIDLATLMDRLGGLKELEQVGGAAFIASLIDGVPRMDIVEPYACRIRHAAQVRDLMRACNAIIGECIDDPESDGLIERSQETFWKACEKRDVGRVVKLGDAARLFVSGVESRAGIGDALTGLETGLDELDLLTLGLQRQDVVVLAGRPSQGKTSLACDIARRVAKANSRVFFCSLEMSNERISEKVLSSEARVDAFRMRAGTLQTPEWERINVALYELDSLGVSICDEAGLSALQIRSKAQRMKRSVGLDLLVVDYLQLMGGQWRKGMSRAEYVGQAARELKEIAKDLDCTVLALSQLNRAVENRASECPQLSDLRESGDIEQVADVVIFIYGKSDEPDLRNIAKIDVAKNRCGPTGNFDLIYFRPESRFENADKWGR